MGVSAISDPISSSNPDLAAAPADPDQPLVEAARAGCQESFRQLMVRHHPRLYQLAFGVLGRREEAEDAVQETMVRCWRQLRGFRGRARFGSWLYRICVNAALNQARKRPPEPSPAEERAPGPELLDVVLTHELRVRVREAVGRLSEPQRTAVTLYYFGGWSGEEIAALLGLAPGTVRAHLFNARKHLARRLGPLREE